MNITLQQALIDKIPNFKIGLIHYSRITVAESPQMIKGRVQLYQENLFLECQETPVTERAGIKEWRQTLKQLGSDPNRYRHSAEALLRRIAKQQYLSPIHSAVDLNNFFSLQYESPIGIYDSAKIFGDVAIDLGDENIGYEGLNGRYNTLKGIPYARDEQSAFGSLYVDSARTATSESTTDALHIFYLQPTLSVERANELLHSAGNMFTQISGGDYEIAILTADSPSATF